MAVAGPLQTARSTRATAAGRSRLTARMLRGTALAGLSALAFAIFADLIAAPARAQDNVLDALGTQVDPAEPLLLEATELRYDFDRDRISAIGNVQIYYGGNTVEAERVVFDRRNNRLRAEGNVRLTEPNGNVLRAETMELSEDLRDGFATALQLDTPQRTRFIADGARREDGNRTTFDNGIYTVYTKPTNPPGKPPLWRVRAATIVHNETERTIEFQNASLEFFGRSLVYLPYFSMADPTVKRKTGLLTPSAVVGDRVGVGVTVPYYFALDPTYDLLLSATPLSN